ncbi:chromosomal replication initiator protein DnaA [Desulfovermiculus halophilus]|jgi:chromosomal replication initiator protein|uniref:chromosomal replication initiator protein DnaA n=1 Tax=Desulfovermiculus halophilus TaxID=339722 RepID=UPI000485A26A|nr:chromosomal replication initiator protein DnaA [Desulfovermiculus halophilus]
MNTTWHQIQADLQKSLKPGIFQVWIKPLQAEIQEKTIYLTAPNEFVASWVRDRLRDTIVQAAASTLGYIPDIAIAGQKSAAPGSPKLLQPTSHQQQGRLPGSASRPSPSPYNWRYKFDNFVVGSCNQLAYAACSGLCTDTFPAGSVFLCSSPGLGKTHLLHSIGYHLCQHKKRHETKVCYLPAEHFANQMVKAIKQRDVETFKARYRKNVDVLLLEDVHFFQGKAKMQEELLSLIKDLGDQGSKVVFSSSFLPKELGKVDSQLTSYFCSGVLAPIQQPDLDFRVRLLQAKAQSKGLRLSDSLCHLIASTIRSDVRQLESCLHNLSLKANLLQEPVNEEMTRDVLQNYSQENTTPDMEDIIDCVCRAFDMPLNMLQSKSRKRSIVSARNTAFYMARKYTSLSLKDIGSQFNRRHSTVLKGITNVEREISKDSALGHQVLRIMDQLVK